MVPVTQFNFDPAKMQLEENSGELITVPDQALSLEELYRRAQAGTLPPIALDAVWDENPSLDNAIKPDFDLTDLDATRELIETLQARYEAEKAAKQAPPVDLPPAGEAGS